MPLRDIDDLAPAPYNPRSIEGPAADGLRASLDRFGDIGGITFNRRTGRLVTGHQRVAQLRKLGATMQTDELGDAWLEAGGRSFRVRVVDWDEGEEKAANVSANNPHIGGDFTGELDALLGELQRTMEPEAFGGLGLDALLAEQPSAEAGAGDVEQDEVPEPPTEPVTKLGDVWALGEHRLVCGDSTDGAVASLSLYGRKPLMMVTDPPYGIVYGAGGRPAIQENMKGVQARASGQWLQGDDRVDWSQSFALFAGPVAYVWCSPMTECETRAALASVDMQTRSVIVWVKDSFALSPGHYNPQYESCVYAARKGCTSSWVGPANESTVWSIARNRERSEHPTCKPVECMARAMRNHGGADDSVYDPFAGSGTTLIAAEQLGRRAHCIEIEPRYCDVIIERWEQLTGGKAKKVTT